MADTSLTDKYQYSVLKTYGLYGRAYQHAKENLDKLIENFHFCQKNGSDTVFLTSEDLKFLNIL